MGRLNASFVFQLYEWTGIYPALLLVVANFWECVSVRHSDGLPLLTKFQDRDQVRSLGSSSAPQMHAKLCIEVVRNNNTHTHALQDGCDTLIKVATPNSSFWDLDAYSVLIWTLLKTSDLLQPSPALENLKIITHIWHSLLQWSYFIFQAMAKESPLFTVRSGWDTYSDLWVLKLL